MRAIEKRAENEARPTPLEIRGVSRPRLSGAKLDEAFLREGRCEEARSDKKRQGIKTRSDSNYVHFEATHRGVRAHKKAK
jgi:hypothetical protein